MTTGQIAQRASVRPSAVRYYESIGLLRPARVRGQRRFTEGDLSRLRLIATAKDASFSLFDIRGILAGDRPDWKPAATRKLEELDAVIANARAQKRAVTRMLTCSCESIVECAARSVHID